MLSLMLALLADPTTPPPAEPTPSALSELEAQAAQIIRLDTPECGNARLQRADTVSQPREPEPVMSDLMYRSDDTVRSYLLLDRRVNGCAAPISFELRMTGETLRRR